MLSADYIRRLDGDSECIDALAYLAEHGRRYKSGGFTPPLTPKKRATEKTPFLAVSLRIGRVTRLGPGARVSRVDWSDGESVMSADGSDDQIARSCADRLFTATYSGYLLITSGKKRQVLDTWLDSQGRSLLESGYTLSPCLSGGGVSFCVIRRGRYKWTLALIETVTGVETSVSVSFAQSVGRLPTASSADCRSLHGAIDAVSNLYLDEFGCALQPTVGMLAMNAARVTLPVGFRKWRPAPLLVAMERTAFGYRGGMTYAERYSGPSARIDVTRQYTGVLRNPLPHQWTFGRFPGFGDGRLGVYVCRLRLGNGHPYPLGVWSGPESGFRLQTVARGEYVSVLHTSEIDTIVRAGGFVWPEYGYTVTSTFTLARHVDGIQNILERFGRESSVAKLTKPLGNYVYGKFGQNPRRTELLFSNEYPGDEWYPYADEMGVFWDNIWEKPVERYTASQHIDIAGTITAYARAQTCQMWQSLAASGARVVRCHTDSLTLAGAASAFDGRTGVGIGQWRVESEDRVSVIAGPNAYSDDGGAHIGGVSEPTYEMLERMHDGHVVGVQQRMRKPRRGFERGEVDTERKVRATAT